ncbi:hypothetical protein BU25DRAFT_23362 [Macroventuria anomochaeta]|uniref:Uncharacterized protein n=1 Tax=Macroventuria anomochaeta TaxID=301207 RepID=A0ACB6S6A3_9PLEO|nr:uncharacterized protein BU25DRAFT_23362 [Macroventuria anomochaeta]KAF2628898.1 hypothetical protein BU25DRAFT_23362 [Macroventuria anomochaeta]
MKYDLNLTFEEIFNDLSSALLNQLMDIQHHKAKREASEQWVEQLRFIDILDVPSSSDRHKSQRIWKSDTLVLPLTEQQKHKPVCAVNPCYRFSAHIIVQSLGGPIHFGNHYRVCATMAFRSRVPNPSHTGSLDRCRGNLPSTLSSERRTPRYATINEAILSSA